MTRMDKRVRFQCRGITADGETIEDSKDETIEVVLGAMQLMKPLEKALLEMEIGEERTVYMKASEAYGERDENAVQNIACFYVPDSERLVVGDRIMWRASKDADSIPALVVSNEDGLLTLDFNHPLAGRDISYWVRLADVLD